MKRRLTGPLCIVPLALGACAPNVVLPTAPAVLSTEWSRETGPVTGPASFPRSLGAAFNSTELEGLIARALAANPDIRIASARIAQARAQLRIARGAMLPVVSGSAGLNASRSDNQGGPFDFSNGFAGVDVSYDLDLFGAGRAERRAARQRIRAASFDREAIALVVQSEVARSYVQYAALTQRIALLDRNIEQALELDRIIRVRMRLGEGTRVDVGLQTIQVRQLQAERLRLVEAKERTQNALAVLTGEEAPRFDLDPVELDTLSPPGLDVVQPPELLLRRPDVRAAEARIRAANGDVAQARAAFMPTIRLSASALGQAATLSGPLGSTLTAGASLLAPIFDRGRLHGNLALSAANQLESVETYRQTLLNALGETEDALTGTQRSREREALLVEVVEEARVTARLARRQYIEGEADLRWVLDAEQLLVQAEDARAVALQERLEAAIDLFRAMGGSPVA